MELAVGQGVARARDFGYFDYTGLRNAEPREQKSFWGHNAAPRVFGALRANICETLPSLRLV
jgi:hypothetical protein